MNLQGAEPELSALCNDDEIYERKFSIRSFASKSNTNFVFVFLHLPVCLLGLQGKTLHSELLLGFIWFLATSIFRF